MNSNSKKHSLGDSLSGLSEFSEHEEEFLNLSKKVQEKEDEIETLRKDIREMERDTRKAQIEIENERDFWKLKAETFQKDYSSKPLIKLANDLQEKLSEKEREILGLKDSELLLKRELFQVKEQNLKLRNAKAVLDSRGNRVKSVSIDLNHDKNNLFLALKPQPSSYKLSQIDEKAELQGGIKASTHDILFATISELKEEKAALEENLAKIKEVAIDSVVEKEKELIEARNKCEELEVAYRNQLDLANSELEVLRRKVKYVEGDVETSSPKHASSLMEFRRLENELESVKKVYREEKISSLAEKEALETRVKELIRDNEAMELEFKRKLDKMQKEMDDQVYAKVREDTQTAKDLQQQLLKELQMAEEKYRDLHRKYLAVQQESRNQQSVFEKELAVRESQIKELEKKMQGLHTEEQKRVEFEKRMEGDRKKISSEIESRQEKINVLEVGRLEATKKMGMLEAENGQLKMKNGLLKESLECLKAENEELKSRNNEEMRHFQSSVAELDLKYSQEKDWLEREVKRMKELYEPEGRGTVVFGTLRSDLVDCVYENSGQQVPKRAEQSLQHLSYSPLPDKRVSILEPSNSISQDFPSHQKEEFEKVVEDSEVYLDLKAQIEEREKRLMELEEEKNELLATIVRMEENHRNVVDSIQEEQKLNLTDIQNMRRTFIIRSGEDDTGQNNMAQLEIAGLKEENLRMRKELNENRQIAENEIRFLKEELEGVEKRTEVYKEEYKKAVNERDVYMQKLTHLVGYIKKKKAEKDQNNNGGFFGLRMSLFRR